MTHLRPLAFLVALLPACAPDYAAPPPRTEIAPAAAPITEASTACALAAVDDQPIDDHCDALVRIWSRDQKREWVLSRASGPKLPELTQALIARPADTTTHVFQLLGERRYLGSDDAPAVQAPADLWVDLAIDLPHWRAATEVVAEMYECEMVTPFLQRSGRAWVAQPSAQPGIVNLLVSLPKRCPRDVQRGFEDDDLRKKFGAPLDLSLLDRTLTELPRGMDHLPEMWRWFADSKSARRIDVIDGHLSAYVATAHGIDNCGPWAEGVCGRRKVHESLDAFRKSLSEARDAADIHTFHQALVRAASTPELDAIIGDEIDATVPRQKPLR